MFTKLTGALSPWIWIIHENKMESIWALMKDDTSESARKGDFYFLDIAAQGHSNSTVPSRSMV